MIFRGIAIVLLAGLLIWQPASSVAQDTTDNVTVHVVQRGETLYRIAQEQLNNILKHASAKHVNIHVKAKNKTLYVSIIDDGKGLDPTKKSKGIGLDNILNRVESYNGKIAIDSSPEKGCKIEIAIPL